MAWPWLLLTCIVWSSPFSHAYVRRRQDHQTGTARHLTANTPYAQPDYNIYHRKEVLLARVAEIVKANPNTMSMVVRSAGDAQYNASMQVVDVNLGGAASKDTKKARILLDFGEHAREFVSAEIGLQLMEMLANPSSISQLVGGGERGQKLLAQLQNITFKILPMENERGRDLVEAGKLCERKNGRGVDPNRNWEVDWGKKEKDYDAEEEYPGTGPFSEPETQLVLDIASHYKPHVWLNIHSGMEAMFTPWDHVAQVADRATEALRILQSIKDSVFSETCVVGSGGKSVGYLAHGTATDYMYEKLNVSLPFTWEVYGDFTAPFNDCFKMFNPLTKDHLQKVITMWLKAIFRLIELLPTHPAIDQEAIFGPPRQALAPVTTQPAGTAQGTQPSSTTPTGSDHPQVVHSHGNGQAVPPGRIQDSGSEEVVMVYTPYHILKHSYVWTTLLLGVVGVTVTGFVLYRCVPSVTVAVDRAVGRSSSGSGAMQQVGPARTRNGRSPGWNV